MIGNMEGPDSIMTSYGSIFSEIGAKQGSAPAKLAPKITWTLGALASACKANAEVVLAEGAHHHCLNRVYTSQR